MSNTRTTKPHLIVVAFILSALLLTALVSGGAARQHPYGRPPAARPAAVLLAVRP